MRMFLLCKAGSEERERS